MSFTQPAASQPREPSRDQYGRPLIVPPEGGKAIPYTRMSTVAKMLSDGSAITDWKMRNVAYGMSLRPDLVAKAAAVGAAALAGDRRAKLDLTDVVKAAEAAASSDRAANMGTAVHAFTEMLDEGRDTSMAPPEIRPLLDRYGQAVTMAQIKPVLSEVFVVIDQLRVAGTFDRGWLLNPGLVPGSPLLIGDLKTGATAPGYAHDIVMQVAGYAHGEIYDIDTQERRPLGANLDLGLLIHSPLSAEECSIYTLDLTAGWEALKVAAWVHGTWRKRKDLATRWVTA